MSDPSKHNGGALVAMGGNNCVGMACDRRLGQGLQTISTTFQKVFKMQHNILLGLTGLATDIQTFSALMEYKLSMYKLREGCDMKPSTFASLVSSTLYEHRFGPYFVSPIVAGLEDGKPIVATYDSIGCKTISENFASSGTASEGLFGIAESYNRLDVTPVELEDTLANILVSGTDRDILSGWSGAVYIVTPEAIDIKVVKMKQV